MSHENRARRKAQLLAAYEQGILDEDTYQAARGGHDVQQMPAIRAAAKGFHPLLLTVQPNPGLQRQYPWTEGIASSELANYYNEAGIGVPNGVGCFAAGASPYGCEEMGGNVFEWTRSLYGRYNGENLNQTPLSSSSRCTGTRTDRTTAARRWMPVIIGLE